jgi:hypothetical protein
LVLAREVFPVPLRLPLFWHCRLPWTVLMAIVLPFAALLVELEVVLDRVRSAAADVPDLALLRGGA